MALMELMRWARKALAVSFESSLDQTFVVIMHSNASPGYAGSVSSRSTVPSALAETASEYSLVPDLPESTAESVPAASIASQLPDASETEPAPTLLYLALMRPERGTVSVRSPVMLLVAVSNTGMSENVRDFATNALRGSSSDSPAPEVAGSRTSTVTAQVRPAVEPLYARNTAVNDPALEGTPERTSSFAAESYFHASPGASVPENFLTVAASVAFSSRAMRTSAIGT